MSGNGQKYSISKRTKQHYILSAASTDSYFAGMYTYPGPVFDDLMAGDARAIAEKRQHH